MKKVIWVLIILLFLSNSFWGFKNQELRNQNFYLEDEKNELENELEDLKDKIEDLKSDYKKTILEHKDYLNSQFEYINTIKENISEYNENYSTDNSVSNDVSYAQPKSYIKQLYISLPTYAQTINFDQGKVISPTIQNLHFLNSITHSEFERIMNYNDYSLTTTRESFVNNSTRNCCYTIDKEIGSVTMIFTKSVDNNIESTLANNSIGYSYENGYKRYIYTLGNQKFALFIQSSYDKLILILRDL